MRLAAVPGIAVALFALTSAPAAGADSPAAADEIDKYPNAEGNYTTADDFYGVFFKTPDGRACGIGPNGGPVGCDAVPYQTPDVNQTVVVPGTPATYRYSETPSFTRDVDVVPEGHRLSYLGASCGVGYQGTVTCKTYGHHGFILSSTYSVLW